MTGPRGRDAAFSWLAAGVGFYPPGMTAGPIAPEALQTPKRYTAHGRETLDRIRDLAELGGDLMAEEFAIPNAARALAEYLFMFFCRAQVIKYEDRKGLKGPREADEAKAAFYRAMARHVGFGEPDPRSARPDFRPYERRPWEEGAPLSAEAPNAPDETRLAEGRPTPPTYPNPLDPGRNSKTVWRQRALKGPYAFWKVFWLGARSPGLRAAKAARPGYWRAP